MDSAINRTDVTQKSAESGWLLQVQLTAELSGKVMETSTLPEQQVLEGELEDLLRCA